MMPSASLLMKFCLVLISSRHSLLLYVQSCPIVWILQLYIVHNSVLKESQAMGKAAERISHTAHQQKLWKHYQINFKLQIAEYKSYYYGSIIILLFVSLELFLFLGEIRTQRRRPGQLLVSPALSFGAVPQEGSQRSPLLKTALILFLSLF